MWRLLSRLLNALTFGKFNETLCARLARKRAACRLCRCVCRALEFVPTFGPGHCDDELEMYAMKTVRLPGKLTSADKKQIRAWQTQWGIYIDGIWGTQSTGQLAIVLDDLERENSFLKAQIRNLYIMLAVALAGGAGVLGSM